MNKWGLILLSLCIAGLAVQTQQARQKTQSQLSERDQVIEQQHQQILSLEQSLSELADKVDRMEKQSVAGMADQAGDAMNEGVEVLKKELDKAKKAIDEQIKRAQEELNRQFPSEQPIPQAESDNNPV